MPLRPGICAFVHQASVLADDLADDHGLELLRVLQGAVRTAITRFPQDGSRAPHTHLAEGRRVAGLAVAYQQWTENHARGLTSPEPKVVD
jgi:hypothetical protein